MTRCILPALLALLAGATLTTRGAAQQPVRGPEVERLGFLVGRFEGEVRASYPGSAEQAGRMTWEGAWDLDGWIVRGNYVQSLPATPAISGLLVFRWRPRDSTYAFEGYANSPMDPHRLAGRWEDRLVFEGRMGGASFRETWQAQGTDTLVTAMEFQQGERWVTVTRATLVRRR